MKSQRTLENVKKRNEVLLTEISKRNIRKIDKRKYYGVKTNIVDYHNLIVETFFDEKLVNQVVEESQKQTEDLHSALDLMVDELNKRINQIWAKVSTILFDSFKKGTKRIQLSNGGLIKIGEIEDSPGIQELIKKQDTYFKNLTKDQSILINKALIQSRKDGLSAKDTAQLIIEKTKDLSRTRATAIARTEVIKSHNVGQVEVMKKLDVKYYNFITANDSKVCKICRNYQGPMSSPKRYLVELAGNKDNPLPALSTHPHCRCSIVVVN